MKHWPLPDFEVQAHHPQVLSSHPEGRAILLLLPAGETLQEHQVHERAWVMIVGGDATVELSNGESVAAPAGALFEFEPAERHSVTAHTDVRLLLLLAPWPGEGHPSQPNSP